MSENTVDMFADSARSLLQRSRSLERLRVLRGNGPGFERSAWQQIVAAGWLSITVPESQGGLGLGLPELCAVAEEAGRWLVPEPFLSVLQATTTLSRWPESMLQASLLAGALDGQRVLGLAWQERFGQLAPQAPTTTAVRDGDCLVLNGCKLAVAPGRGADGWLVSVLDSGETAWVWVPAEASGLHMVDDPRIDGSAMVRLELTDARVPQANVLARGHDGLEAAAWAVDLSRIAQGAELLGVARRALAITQEHLQSRTQFDSRIGSFQALQHRMVDAYIQAELAAACITDVSSQLERQAAPMAACASRVKARCAHAALEVTRLALQLHGAMGITDECDIGLYFKRALHQGAWLGNAGSHRRRYLALRPQTAPAAPAGEGAATFPTDADWDAMPEAEFRAMVRAFLALHYPPALRHMARKPHRREIRAWHATLAQQGWIAPAWPKAFGGMGLAPDKQLAFIEEQEQFGVAAMSAQAIGLVGPLLIRYGSEEQRRRFLPKILSGEHYWCQGYSEPGAGSDLASLRTEAVLDGDDFVVNGQKIWTTLAQDATHIFALVRTDKNAAKQAGISFLLIDMATPGITVRPIGDLVGNADFCEVFFDAVRVPRANLVGEMNQGWHVAKTVLGFERLTLGSPRQPQFALSQLSALAAARDLMEEPVFAARYGELLLDVADLGAAYAGFAEIARRGQPLPPSVSLLKIWASETAQRIGLQLVSAADELGGSAGPAKFGTATLEVAMPLLNANSAAIYGGTNEIQRNIIAKGVLGLGM